MGTNRVITKTFLAAAVYFVAVALILMGVASVAQAEKTLIIAQAGDIAVLDNMQSAGSARDALIEIYDWGWIRYQTVAAETGGFTVSQELVPTGIIKAWETEKQPDGTFIHRFHIRPGAVHHSGNPITAEYFKYTILRRAGLGRDYLHRFLGGMYHLTEGEPKL